MLDTKHFEYIFQLALFLPDRKPGKRGTKPISKEVILIELFKLLKHGLRWRDINHATVVRNYLYEIQRRGLLKNFLNKINNLDINKKLNKTIIDSTEFKSWRNQRLVSYSGKSHNYSTKLSLEITPDFKIVNLLFGKGSSNDGKELDKMYKNKDKYPNEIYLDKGYESYERRQRFKANKCQLRMEQKNYKKSRKRGRKYMFTKEHKKTRASIEKVFGWIKSFRALRYNRIRTASIFHSFVIIVLAFYSFKLKL